MALKKLFGAHHDSRRMLPTREVSYKISLHCCGFFSILSRNNGSGGAP